MKPKPFASQAVQRLIALTSLISFLIFSRSPEEYSEAELDDKLDIYSAANVLYAILTGEEAWYDYGKTETQKMVMRGVKPAIRDQYRETETDRVIANLTELAYKLDPRERISAAELVAALEDIAIKTNLTTLPSSGLAKDRY